LVTSSSDSILAGWNNHPPAPEKRLSAAKELPITMGAIMQLQKPTLAFCNG
jgi:hypothetical protein